MPERNRRVSSPLSKAIRTGTRCTTFTQFPGRILRRQDGELCTGPGADSHDHAAEGAIGEAIDTQPRLLSDAQLSVVGFFRIGIDPWRLVINDTEHRRAGTDKTAKLDVVDLRGRAGHWCTHDRVVQIPLRAIECSLGLRIL